MYSKIINPKTGRNVTIYGKIGQQILRNYISVLKGGAASKCTNYHSDPIKCQASKAESGKYCVYSAAKTKGVVGQCRKSSAKDIEKSKESSRRRSALETKFQESAALRLQQRFKSKKRIDNFANAAEDMQTREKNKKSIAMTAQIDEDMQTREKNKKSLKMAAQIAKDLQQSKNQKASFPKKLGTKPNSPPPPPPCFKYRKGKCRETRGCMLTKGKKKKCIPCDFNKFNTKDKCLYR